jgi:hypothetical protein
MAWRCGLPAQLTKKSICSARCVSHVLLEEMSESARRIVARGGPRSPRRSNLYREANSDPRNSRQNHTKEYHQNVQSQMGSPLQGRSNQGARGWLESQVPQTLCWPTLNLGSKIPLRG